MSSALERQLAEDRALRDAALALVKADIENLRADMGSRGIGERILDRASDGAVDIYEDAKGLADNHRGAFATLIAAIFVWFARHPIADFFVGSDEDEDREFDDEHDYESEEFYAHD